MTEVTPSCDSAHNRAPIGLIGSGLPCRPWARPFSGTLPLAARKYLRWTTPLWADTSPRVRCITKLYRCFT